MFENMEDKMGKELEDIEIDVGDDFLAEIYKNTDDFLAVKDFVSNPYCLLEFFIKKFNKELLAEAKSAKNCW